MRHWGDWDRWAGSSCCVRPKSGGSLPDGGEEPASRFKYAQRAQLDKQGVQQSRRVKDLFGWSADHLVNPQAGRQMMVSYSQSPANLDHLGPPYGRRIVACP